MFAFKLTRLIESRADQLSEALMKRLKSSGRCNELLQRVPPHEVRKRSHEIYCNLNDWLRTKTEAEIEERYTGLGIRRAKQGVPFTDFVWAVSTTKECLWQLMEEEGLFAEPVDLYGEIELLHSLDRFFDRILYFAAAGYQAAQKIDGEQPTHRHGVAQG